MGNILKNQWEPTHRSPSCWPNGTIHEKLGGYCSAREVSFAPMGNRTYTRQPAGAGSVNLAWRINALDLWSLPRFPAEVAREVGKLFWAPLFFSFPIKSKKMDHLRKFWFLLVFEEINHKSPKWERYWNRT